MNLVAYYLPKAVSFYHLKFRESNCPASTATGFWLDPANYNGGKVDTEHYAGGSPGVPAEIFSAGAGNSDTGTPVTPGGNDTAEFSTPNYDSGGTEVWPIPWNYSVSVPGHVASPFVQFTTAPQKMQGDASGTATISKKGVGPYSKALNDANSDY